MMVSQSVFIGVDPGLSGAVAAISQHGKFICVGDTPVAEVKKGKGAKHFYLPAQMVAQLKGIQAHGAITLIGIELVHAMPGQGVTSMFRMGQGLGMWEMAFVALSLPYKWITPQSWKKELLRAGVGDDKSASIVRAQELFPAAAEFLKRKKDDGRAEAILLAEYARCSSLGLLTPHMPKPRR